MANTVSRLPPGIILPPGVNPASVDPKRFEEALRIEAAKRKLMWFVRWTFPGYHVSAAHKFLAEKLEAFEGAVREKKSPRLMVFLPPRFGKSELTSRRYPGWVLGRNPDWNVGIVSYGAELAEELSADARRVVLSDEYAAVFGRTYQPEADSTVEIDRTSQAVNHWRVAGHRGGVRAVGVGGALTGRGFDVCIIDDPIKGRKEADNEGVRDDLWSWYRGTLRTRIEPGGGILLVQTRWHHDDLAGRLLDAQGTRWEVINLPAIAEEGDPLGRQPGDPLDAARYDVEALDEIREDVGDRDWWAQYQGKPTPDEGDIFHKDWFVNEPDPRLIGSTFAYLDSAYGKRNPSRKGDRSVWGVWRLEPTRFRCIHIKVGRPSYPELKEEALEIQRVWHPRTQIIEDHASGQSLIQDLRNETRIPVIGWKTKNESKEQRAKAVSPVWQSGRAVCSLPQAQFDAFVREHLNFPNGKFDDMVDMGSMALAHLAIWNAPVRRKVVYRDFRVVA